MTTYLRRTKPHSTGLAVSAAELGITAPAPQPTRGGRENSHDQDRLPGNCVCRKKHWYSDCFILNPQHPRRSKNYCPSAEAIRQVEEAQRDPKTNTHIKAALTK